MGALVLFGVPPEQFWPYEEKKFDREPPAFCYAFAANYGALSYFSLDPPGTKPAELIGRIKTYLAGGVPSMFGFTVYSSIDQAGADGAIPFPGPQEKVAGGHAVVAVGYDDAKKIRNPERGSQPSVGAFLIRNSWGEGWGDRGYGWLPYDYVGAGLAEDWWTLIKAEWVDSGEFGL
jgi:C1A family cysteine protease